MAIHLNGRGQFGTGLLYLSGLEIQGAKATMAVSLEGAHAQFLGQSKGLAVVSFSLCNIGEVGVGLDDTKLVQRMRLVAAFLELPGQVERLTSVLPGLLTASS